MKLTHGSGAPWLISFDSTDARTLKHRRHPCWRRRGPWRAQRPPSSMSSWCRRSHWGCSAAERLPQSWACCRHWRTERDREPGGQSQTLSSGGRREQLQTSTCGSSGRGRRSTWCGKSEERPSPSRRCGRPCPGEAPRSERSDEASNWQIWYADWATRKIMEVTSSILPQPAAQEPAHCRPTGQRRRPWHWREPLLLSSGKRRENTKHFGENRFTRIYTASQKFRCTFFSVCYILKTSNIRHVDWWVKTIMSHTKMCFAKSCKI